ncbi:MAG: triose-phosphate isomerase [Kiloniellales bacterium]|nr:triose-phosphate isomerase [Kiloniellales bacterium]
MRRKLIAGNWKMNGLRASAASLIQELLDGISGAEPSFELLACELLVCPPACLLETVGGLTAGTPVELGGQDCHCAEAGAHTGDISAVMLKDAGCAYVILGHSERRSDHGESDALVRAKAGAALAAGLTPIVCVGETAAERDDGRTLAVVETQLAGSLPELGPGRPPIIAYEPVWAIGSGRTPSTSEVGEVHGGVRRWLEARLGAEAAAAVRILYGGSMKPGNAAELLAVPDVDGGLIGGASLKAEDFLAIARACG